MTMTNQSPAEALRQLQVEMIEELMTNQPMAVAIGKIMPRVTAYAATVEREARIDEMLHTTYLLGQGYYRCNHLPDGDIEFIPQADHLAALQGPRDTELEAGSGEAV